MRICVLDVVRVVRFVVFVHSFLELGVVEGGADRLSLQVVLTVLRVGAHEAGRLVH